MEKKIDWLISHIDGEYYATLLPTEEFLQQIVKTTEAELFWNDLRGSNTKRKIAQSEIRRNDKLRPYKIDTWTSDPFAFYGYNFRYHGAVCLSSALTMSRRRKVSFPPRTEILYYKDWDKNVEMVSDRYELIPVRPKLSVYCMESGHISPWHVREAHPDGTLVKMGTFYIDGEPVDPGLLGEIIIRTDTDFCIDDTYDDEHAIEWVYQGGYMMPTQNLFRVYAGELLQIMGKP